MDALYVEDTLIDLPVGFGFAITIAPVDIGDIAIRNVKFTNTVLCPWTPTNQQKFAFAWNEKVSSTMPYRKLSCRLVQNGVETIPEGVCWIISASGAGVTLGVFENLITVFDTIGERTLNLLGHVAPSAWTAAGIDAARLNTSGVIAAILNWGKAGAIYQFDNFLPCFFIHDMVRAILAQSGLSLSGTILSSTDLTDLVIPYCSDAWIYPEGFGVPYTFKVGKNASGGGLQSFSMVPVANFYTVEMNTEFYQGSAKVFSLPLDYSITPNIGLAGDWLSVTLSASLRLEVDAWAVGQSFRVRAAVYSSAGVFKGGQFTTVSRATYGPPPTGLLTIVVPSLDIVLAAGDQVKLEVGFATAGPNIDITVYDHATLNFLECTYSITPNRNSVVWSQLFPDNITQKDILRDFTTRFGILYRQVGNTLFLKTLKEIIADTSSAVDWTNKRVATPLDSVTFNPPFAQSNYMKFDNLVSDDNLGSGFFTITNVILDKVKTLFTSVLGNALTTILDGGPKATVNVYEGATAAIADFQNPPGLRLCTLRAKDASESSISFNGVPRADYKVAYFVDVTRSKDTSFQYFMEQYYALFASSLQQGKLVTHYYNLSEADIASYDPHRMIYDDGAYYITPKINNYIPGRVTKVELFKL